MTFMNKDPRNGWKAVDEIKLEETPEGTKVLVIRTSKNSSGELVTHASVCIAKDSWQTHRMYEDYSQWQLRSNNRCTEKNVEEQHAKVLQRLDAIKAEVVAFYAAKSTKSENENGNDS